jgi:very-short-patch-repair endonuclease
MQSILTKQDYTKYQSLLQAARKLRKQQTSAEQLFWQHIKKRRILNIKFNRQQILLNSYIVDFYAPAIKLAIELDGTQHTLPEHQEKDLLRDARLHSVGITLKRYSNIIINNNIDLVTKDLRNCIKEILIYNF